MTILADAGKAQIGKYKGEVKIIYTSRYAMPQLKEIGARFDNVMRIWHMPILMHNLRNLQRIVPNVELSRDLQVFSERPSGYRLVKDVSSAIAGDTWEVAKSHQRTGLQYAFNQPFNGYLFGIGKGLGKSFTSISLANALKAKRILVVCIKPLIPTWQYQIWQWSHQEEAVSSHAALPAGVKWNITNFETLRNYDYATGYDWDMVIVDESVLVQHRGQTRNRNGIVRKGTQRTDDVKSLRAVANYMALLSGSPTSKHADGLWPQFNILFPKHFTSYWRFVASTCDTVKTAWGTKIVGTKDTVDIGDEFKDVMYRVTTEEVMGPTNIAYEEVVVELHPEQSQVYDDLMQEFEAELNGAEISAENKMARLVRFGQAVSNLSNLGPDWPDMSAKEDVLLDILAQYEAPRIIWTYWQQTGISLYNRMLAKKFKVGVYNGALKSDGAIEKFNSGENDHLIISLGTGKFGFTFAANTAFYLDKWFDADAYGQSLSRISGRIGVNTNPTVVSLVVPHTIDDLVADNLAGKLVSISKVSGENLIRLLGGLK